ncbi:MAG: WD40 repeat domain-containing protein [Treponema sp.]|nr:WD40 repeat domain-containing protein [Treponema sp.]
MAKKKKKYWIIAGFLLFIVYFSAASRPIPRETILKPQWLSSLESSYPVFIGENSLKPETTEDDDDAVPAEGESAGPLLSFTLGDRFGYVDSQGRFSMNRIKTAQVSLSEDYWSEYGAEPGRIEVYNSLNSEVITIEDGRAYPLFLDKRIFLIGSEQNSLSALDNAGKTLWTYDFSAPLTCIDAAGGIILTGSLDGVVEVLDSGGKHIFSFEPGGSRLPVILGCAVSPDGSRLGIISGIDDQRFLLLERFGDTANGEYKVVYHEFLEDGFRRAVFISFIEQNGYVVFERAGGLGVYKISARKGIKVPLEGTINAIDNSGGDGLLFIVTSPSAGQKKLIALKLPGRIIMEAPFKSETVFLGRSGSRIYTGGRTTMASFDLEKR